MEELIELFGESSCAIECLTNGCCACDNCRYNIEKVIEYY